MSVKSKAIVRIKYEQTREDLHIKFKNGKEYIFTPVNEVMADNFKEAQSKGQFFNKYIKDNPALMCLQIKN